MRFAPTTQRPCIVSSTRAGPIPNFPAPTSLLVRVGIKRIGPAPQINAPVFAGDRNSDIWVSPSPNVCAVWCPVYVEYDVGTLFVPVGLPRPDTGDPEAVFAGLARSIVSSGPDTATKVQDAINQIFAQWPDPRICP